MRMWLYVGAMALATLTPSFPAPSAPAQIPDGHLILATSEGGRRTAA